MMNVDGEIEMDCLLMRGSDLRACSVASTQTTRNPIQLAQKMMHSDSLV